MSNDINKKLNELNIKLDEASAPAGSYVPYVITGNLVFISGQLPFINGKITTKGKVGENVSVEEGIKMAEACAKTILSQLKEACNGDLNKVKKVVKIGGFVASAPDFTDHPKIINGALPLNKSPTSTIIAYFFPSALKTFEEPGFPLPIS